MANERAVGPVLKHLEGTEVGSREGAREKELEWQRKDNQEGETNFLIKQEKRQELRRGNPKVANKFAARKRRNSDKIKGSKPG